MSLFELRGTMSRVRRAGVGLGFLGVLLLLSGCLPSPSAWVGSGPRVAVAGDSEIYQLEHDAFNDAQHHMTDAFVAAAYRVSVSSLIGATTRDLAGFAQSSASTAGWPHPGPRITVTALGVNDMRIDTTTGQPSTPFATAKANYTAYLNAVDAAGSRCDVLVEIPNTTPWGLNQTGPTWNAFLASTAASRVAVVVPWAGMVAQHPEYLLADGVHQTALGKAAYLEAILGAVGQCAAQSGQ
jgi:lysophospholipase L1-like esterase